MRKAWRCAWPSGYEPPSESAFYRSPEPDAGKHYRFFNEVGARLYNMSKGKICNREPKGYEQHCKKEIAAHVPA